MPKIILDPAIPDNIRVLDYHEYANASADKQRELMDMYEAGLCLVFRNYRFPVGRGFFDKLRFPDDRKSKKMILSTPENDHRDVPRDAVWQVVAEIFGDDHERREQFRQQVVAANSEVFRLVGALFPGYGYTRRMCIYNLTEMFAHNLHFDSPQHAEESTQLRMFINLDDQPRIWHLSESLENVARRHYHRLHLEHAAGENVREFTRALTQGVYGSRYQSGSHREHRHSILFQPGEVWCLNPNMTAHEVVFGRRLLDVVSLFGQDQLRNPDRFYPEIVRRLHREHGVGWRLLLHRLRGRLARLWR